MSQKEGKRCPRNDTHICALASPNTNIHVKHTHKYTHMQTMHSHAQRDNNGMRELILITTKIYANGWHWISPISKSYMVLIFPLYLNYLLVLVFILLRSAHCFSFWTWSTVFSLLFLIPLTHVLFLFFTWFLLVPFPHSLTLFNSLLSKP